MTTLDAWVAMQRGANPLWPWDDNHGDGVAWPLQTEAPRLSRYQDMIRLYDGEHWAVFESGRYASYSSRSNASRNYIAQNYIRVACREVLRCMAGSELEIEGGGAVAQEIADRSDMNKLARELMRDRMRLGDGALVVRETPDGVVIERQDPTICYPIATADSRTKLEEVRLAYEHQVRDAGTTQTYVYIVRHAAGYIEHTLWLVDKGVLRGPEPFGAVPYVAALAGAAPTDAQVIVPTRDGLMSTLVWSPRDPQGDLWGDPLCWDAQAAQMLLNRRETQRNLRLTAMDDPMLVVNEADVQQELDEYDEPTGRSVFRLSASEVIVRQSDENIPPPQWISADPNLDANERAQDDHRRAFAMLAGISVESITQDATALTAASGESLRMRFLPTVLTSEEESREACQAIGEALRIAVWLQGGSDPGDITCSLPASNTYAEQDEDEWFGAATAAPTAQVADETNEEAGTALDDQQNAFAF